MTAGMTGQWRDRAKAEAFFAAYDRVLARWPVPPTWTDLSSEFGHTQVLSCGPEDGPALILLPGGGATATVWFDNIADLSRGHRVHALDLIGVAGRSRADGHPIEDRDDLMSWLDGVLDGLGLLGAGLVGHSYGAWIALSYALHAPRRVRGLVLLDPTQCFAGMRVGYLARAVPLLLRPTAARQRALIEYETAGADLDPEWLELVGLGAAGFPSSKIVAGPRPEPDRLAACTVPTLVLLAGQSRAHDVEAVARSARRLMPRSVVTTVPGPSHHGLPMQNAAELDRLALEFLAAN